MSDVEFSGPVFEPGEWDAIMSKGLSEVQDTVADTVLDMWRDTLDYNIKVNQGRYIGELNVAREDNVPVLNDRVSLYGPWLEGTGSRNAPRTRFEGYHSARDTAAAAQDNADLLAAEPLGVIVEAMNA